MEWKSGIISLRISCCCIDRALNLAFLYLSYTILFPFFFFQLRLV